MPSTSAWSTGRGRQKPKNVHAKVINCNYAVGLGKSAFGFSLVGISGKDIQDGIVKLVLALTWQLMRFHVIRFLSSLSTKQVTEKDVLQWANAKVTSAGLAPVQKLSDARFATGTPCSLAQAVAPAPSTCPSRRQARPTPRRSSSATRHLVRAWRAAAFCLWEDITECKPKMMLKLLATLMQLDLKAEAEKAEQ